MFIRRLPEFEYHAPSSIAEAASIMAQYGTNSCFIAGGTDLLLAMKKREVSPQHLVSLTGIASLIGISTNEAGDVRIGALTTLSEIERSDIVKRRSAALFDAVNVMASAQIRSLATIGGNLCSAVPSADTAPPLMALNASLKIVGPEQERVVAIEEFFTGPRETILKRNEILSEIIIPNPGAFSANCYMKLMRRSAMDLALVGVAAFIKLDEQKKVCKDVRIALGAVAPTPLRVPESETLLRNKAVTEKQIAEAAKAAGMQCRPISDIRASLEYRRGMVEVLTKRALLEALKRISA